MDPLCFAFYCSGHGYGHATRVSALASHLRLLNGVDTPDIWIVSSAPQRVFSEAISNGARYRQAEIDPVIVQPLAYSVDRRQSLRGLQAFLDKKQVLLQEECAWLMEINARCVLSDAAFLGCLAAKMVGIPSILVTNFTFDSVYSYLSTTLLDTPSPHSGSQHLLPHSSVTSEQDAPIPQTELAPLVEEIHAGYRCADFLFLLPGHIPIPSFSLQPSLPSHDWVEPRSNKLLPEVLDFLNQTPSSYSLYPTLPVPPSSPRPCSVKSSPRIVIPAPLLVRTPSRDVYTPKGRSLVLSSIGVPIERHDPDHTKILVVSFGGQVFRRPGSRNSSRPPTPTDEPTRPPAPTHLVTTSHIYIPGAPPTTLHSPKPSVSTFSFETTPPTPGLHPGATFEPTPEIVDLLPDASWIAVVCGVSKEQWSSESEDSELPEGFYVAPRDVYMPDLTAIADVLLGKLGYGTVSECVDSCTPFVYVSRPLFIEEHGLRLLLDKEGVGVELTRRSYEEGGWAFTVEEAWKLGRDMKAKKRRDMSCGVGVDRRAGEGAEMARTIMGWVHEWWAD